MTGITWTRQGMKKVMQDDRVVIGTCKREDIIDEEENSNTTKTLC